MKQIVVFGCYFYRGSKKGKEEFEKWHRKYIKEAKTT